MESNSVSQGFLINYSESGSSHRLSAIPRKRDKNKHVPFLYQVLELCLNFSLIQHTPENVAEDTRDTGGLRVEPVVFISRPSVLSVGNIKTHITAQVKGLTNSDTGFRMTQDLYLSLVSLERKLIHQERKCYAKITY